MAKKFGKKRKSSKKKPKKKQKRSFLGGLVKWLFVLGLWAGIIGGGLTAWYAAELPEIAQDLSFARKAGITVKASDGSIIARYGNIKGNTVTVEDLPSYLIYALLATEDRRFYQHFGLDPLGLARAMMVNVKAGRLVQGGSTITQQLAKNLFLSQERTIKRKIQEALLALWLEHELSKDEILSAYLNRVYLGAGAYGVDAASKLYFHKPATQVTLHEAALLAGLLKAPSRYSPLHNPELARQRTNVVLGAMADTGYITGAQAKKLAALPPQEVQKPAGDNTVRYFTDWVIDGIDDLIGSPSEDLVIETTLNPATQKTTEEALVKTIQNHGEEKKISQGAALVMRPDGGVVAMVGGTNYNQTQFNRAVQARRQPGSAFKPVLYLTALEQGWKTDSIILDAPIEEGKYRPKNFSDEYMGEVNLETALARSLNTAAVRLMKDTGRRPVIDNARKLGIHSKLEPDLSLALGSSSISLIEMTTVYSVLANGGMSVYPFAITKITNQDGDLYYQRPERRTARRVADKKHIKDLTAMMQSAIENGTGRRARLNFKAAGKTGTSQDSRDAWFIGFTDEIVTGVWLGNDDNTPMDGVTGGSYPALIWRDIMSETRGQHEPVKAPGFISSRFQDLLGKLIPSGENEDRPPRKRSYNN